MPKLKQRRPGRPQAETLSVSEVAALLEVPERAVRARARLSFFAGAKETEDGKDWQIPADAVRAALRCRLEPHWSVKTWAGVVGLSYHDLYRVVAPVASLDEPLPAGKQVRALRIVVGDSGRMRIPESEILRWLGYSTTRRAAV